MIVIRNCSGFDELEACVQLQIETWGYDDSDVIPRKAFLVGQKIGGQVIGAFDTDLPGAGPEGTPESMVGFAMSLPGVKTSASAPQPYLHSHMLAVRPSYRNRGLGAQLKLRQRLEALSRNLRLMEWTFDPLEIKNAYLNIHKLGAVVRCYHVNFYGVSSSRLQGGLPTDRLVAEWHLGSSRVTTILDGKSNPAFTVEERISVPASIYQWKASDIDRGRAMTVQLQNRQKFQEAFNRGLAVLGFTRDPDGNGVFELGSPTQAEMD
ncbi:MAG TPA: GNAT family N-acetyltransferase [Terracidiphilus sp.]|jgi:predicted GNAT superfamily acetyltransferase|nr:GNAT family N-acetyltransferase [Terracidiphilus sp.]